MDKYKDITEHARNYKAIIGALRYFFSGPTFTIADCKATMDAAADAIEELLKHEWIPCDKGEPDEDMECWVTVKTTDALYRGNFTKRYGERRDKGFITSGGFMWWNTALAWMPIYEPEPYKGEE